MTIKTWKLGPMLIAALLLFGCSKSDAVSASIPSWDDAYSRGGIIEPITSVAISSPDRDQAGVYLNADAIKNMFRDMFFDRWGYSGLIAGEFSTLKAPPWQWMVEHFKYRDGSRLEVYVATEKPRNAVGADAKLVSIQRVFHAKSCYAQAILYGGSLKTIEVWISPRNKISLLDDDILACMNYSFIYVSLPLNSRTVPHWLNG